MELHQSALTIQEENIELRNRILELEAQVRRLESLEGEPCPRCRKKAWIVESSKANPTLGRLEGVRRTYKCTERGLKEATVVTPK
jgi:hypothetical protein